MPNLKSKIAAHNKKIISKTFNTNIILKKCNCQKSRKCPLDGQCVVENVVYKAEVLKEGENIGEGHTYIGLAGGPFKLRLANHNQSFKKKEKRKDSKLSEFVWDLKDSGHANFDIKWSILAEESGYNRKIRRCKLCVREKVEVLKNIHHNPSKTLNKREEVFRRCLHRFKHFLGHLLNERDVKSCVDGDHNFRTLDYLTDHENQSTASHSVHIQTSLLSTID